MIKDAPRSNGCFIAWMQGSVLPIAVGGSVWPVACHRLVERLYHRAPRLHDELAVVEGGVEERRAVEDWRAVVNQRAVEGGSDLSGHNRRNLQEEGCRWSLSAWPADSGRQCDDHRVKKGYEVERGCQQIKRGI